MGCWGNFTGGDLGIPALRHRLQFHPGDVLVSSSCSLEHYILPFEGERSSVIFFSQDGVMGHYEPNKE